MQTHPHSPSTDRQAYTCMHTSLYRYMRTHDIHAECSHLPSHQLTSLRSRRERQALETKTACIKSVTHKRDRICRVTAEGKRDSHWLTSSTCCPSRRRLPPSTSSSLSTPPSCCCCCARVTPPSSSPSSSGLFPLGAETSGSSSSLMVVGEGGDVAADDGCLLLYQYKEDESSLGIYRWQGQCSGVHWIDLPIHHSDWCCLFNIIIFSNRLSM